MNRNDAKYIAKIITNDELKEMFDNAKQYIKNWTKTATVNKSFTKGAAWNILASDFDVNYNYHNLAKVNMIREFGDYLPERLKPKKKEKVKIIPQHRTPVFND